MEGIKEVKENIKKQIDEMDFDKLKDIDEEKLLKLNMNSKVSEVSELFGEPNEFTELLNAGKHILYGLIKIGKTVKEE
jgi:hypothetical protein